MKLYSQIQEVPGSIVLIIVNIMTIFGVIFLDWDLFSIMFLYWCETAIIALYTFIKIFYAGYFGIIDIDKTKTSEKPNKKIEKTISKIMVIPTILFLGVHSSIFMICHLMFIFVLFADINFFAIGSFSNIFQTVINYITIIIPGIILLLLSHGYSFKKNFIENKEYTSLKRSFGLSLYGRIILMHVVIIATAFLMGFLGSPKYGVILLILIKTVFDLIAHIKEHKQKV